VFKIVSRACIELAFKQMIHKGARIGLKPVFFEGKIGYELSFHLYLVWYPRSNAIDSDSVVL